jgi:hypothetical protein
VLCTGGNWKLFRVVCSVREKGEKLVELPNSQRLSSEDASPFQAVDPLYLNLRITPPRSKHRAGQHSKAFDLINTTLLNHPRNIRQNGK